MPPTRTVVLALGLALLGGQAPGQPQPGQPLEVLIPLPPPAGGAPAGQAGAADQAAADKKDLEAAGLSRDDPAGLVAYFVKRTPGEADLVRIRDVIKRLGAEEFDDRQQASREADRLGPAAVALLREAADDPGADPEVAYRARETLRRTETVPHAAVAGAAARALAAAKPPGAAAALLGFLPRADTPAVADEVRAALTATAVRNGQADPALVAGLADPDPVRRAAAAVALVEGGPAAARVWVPDAYLKVVAAAKAEPDPEARFRMLFAVLTVARDKDAVGPLIDALPDLPRPRLWQAEDYLLQLAGQAPPKAVFGKSADSLIAARDAWRAWWAKAAGQTDLTAVGYAPRVTGRTVLVLINPHLAAGAVVELGPDMRERWRVPGLSNPADVQFFPDGTSVIAEQGTNRVAVRDARGRVVGGWTLGGGRNGGWVSQPNQVQALGAGHVLVASRNMVAEYKPGSDDPVMAYHRPNMDVLAARRLADGRTAVLCQNGPPFCVFVDARGREVGDRKAPVRQPNYQGGHLDAPAPDRLLATENGRVAEFDVLTGKEVWAKAVVRPQSVQRLPNGNTLVVAGDGPGGAARVVEFASDGTEVWAYQPALPMHVVRAYRR